MSNIYKQSLNRKQQQFFPPSLDEYVVNPEKPSSNIDYNFTIYNSTTP